MALRQQAPQRPLTEREKEIDRTCEANPLFWGMLQFNHYLKRGSPDFHLEVIEAACDNLNLVVQAPRGSAKSTLLTLIFPCHGIFYKKYRFIIIVQNTFKKAAATLDNIKAEFRENPRMTPFNIKFLKDAEGDTIFIHRDGFKTRVICKGADQLGTIRGERFGSSRPDLVLIDDLEDDEIVKNPERRQDLEKQFNEVLKYAGDHGTTRTIVVGTILHDDSLLAKLLARDKYTNFKKMFYMARYEYQDPHIGKYYESLWPEKWSVADLNLMEKEDPEGFAKEMQGDPSSGTLETIQRKDFRYWRMEENQAVLYGQDGEIIARWQLKDCRAAVGIDLAWEQKKTSDFAAIVPGLVTPSNDLLICDYILRRGLRPDEFEEIVFGMNESFEKMTGKRVQFGFEKAKLEKVMKWFLEEAMKRRGKYLWFKDIAWGTRDKIERIMFRVANRYAQHSVYHKKGMGDLENQLVRLRSTAHDDLADAVAMLPEMLYYASSVTKPKTVEGTFDFLRRHTSNYRQKHQSKYIFGTKHKPLPFKVVEAI